MAWGKRRTITLLLFGMALLPFVSLAVLSMFANRPSDLGARDGQLSPCPNKPNCVNTQSNDSSDAIDPIKFSGEASVALETIRSIIESLPRNQIVSASDDYLHAEFFSRFFRFTDDVEFLIDSEGGVIHFRSASRVGHSDLGVNRLRMEAIRSAFQDRTKLSATTAHHD
jgi:uncharacterized protein (DUF1499 family)